MHTHVPHPSRRSVLETVIDIPRHQPANDIFFAALRVLIRHGEFHSVNAWWNEDDCIHLESDLWEDIQRFTATLQLMVNHALSGEPVAVYVKETGDTLLCENLHTILQLLLQRRGVGFNDSTAP